MVAWEIEVRRDPANPILVNARIVPLPENHANAGTTHILESCVNAGTIHICVDMLTVVRIPWRNGSPIMLLWMQ